MPYGMCVAGGVVAGVISMVALVHTESPRAMPAAELPLGTTVASPQTVVLEQKSSVSDIPHSANLMFDNLRPTLQTTNATPGVTLPIGERVRVHYGEVGMWRAGILEAADDNWIQIRFSDGSSRTWIAVQDIRTIDTIQPTDEAKDE